MKKPNPLFKDSIVIWFAFYKHKTGQQYVMDGQQGKHLKMLLKKVETKVKQQGMEASNENVLNSLKGFLSSLNDQWILEHLEIAIINSKFNILYAKAIRSNPFTATDRISDIVERRNSERATG